MTSHHLVYRGRCHFFVRPYRQGWHVDIEIDGTPKGSYTHSEEPGGVPHAVAIQAASRIADRLLAAEATGSLPGQAVLKSVTNGIAQER